MGDAARWRAHVGKLHHRFPGQVSLALAPRYDGQDPERFQTLAATARALGIPPVATGLPFLHHGGRRRLADVLTAVRLGVTVDKLGRRALPNNEGRLRSRAEMLRIFKGHEAAVHNAGEVAARAAFSLDELQYDYPSENAPNETASQRLARLAEAGLHWRYPEGPPAKVRAQMAHELTLGVSRTHKSQDPIYTTNSTFVTQNLYDPVANIAASMNYVMRRYHVARDGSNLSSVGQFNPPPAPGGY